MKKISFYHDIGYVKNEIEKMRKKLNQLVINNENNLLDQEVIQISQQLDLLIVEYSKKKAIR